MYLNRNACIRSKFTPRTPLSNTKSKAYRSIFLTLQMKENQIGITAEIRLNWTDSRLTFTNMFGKIRLDEVIGKIWHPNIVLIGAKYENNVKLRKGIDDLRFLYGESSTNGTQVVVNSSRGERGRARTLGVGGSMCLCVEER